MHHVLQRPPPIQALRARGSALSKCQEAHLQALSIVGACSVQHSAEQPQLKLEGDQVLMPAVACVGAGLKQDVLRDTAHHSQLAC